jgi:hypothetical protein
LKTLYEQDLKNLRQYFKALNNNTALSPREPDTQYLLWLKARLDDGILYTTGGINEQPEWYIEDMQYLSKLDYFYDLPYRITECAERLEQIAKNTAKDMPKPGTVR